jgi:hypothetical protein
LRFRHGGALPNDVAAANGGVDVGIADSGATVEDGGGGGSNYSGGSYDVGGVGGIAKGSGYFSVGGSACRV